MRRKIYVVLFVLFLLIGGISAYNLISDQVDYHAATEYYESFAAAWTKPRQTGEAGTDVPEAVAPAETEKDTPSGSQGSSPAASVITASVPSETIDPSEAIGDSETIRISGTIIPVETIVDSETTGDAETIGDSCTADISESAAPSGTVSVAVARETPGNTADLGTVVPSDTGIPAETKVSWSAASETAVSSSENAVSRTETDQESDGTDVVLPCTKDQPPISVDFDELHRMNSDIVGWIYCEGTPINYPVLQGKDNDQYLNTRADGKTSRGGSVFIDSACKPDFSSDNTLMYAHNRKTGMFACLPRYRNHVYYESHPVMWLLTPDGDYKVELFAGFATTAASWVYDISFFIEKFRSEYIDKCLESSGFKAFSNPLPGTRLLTLSTCYYYGADNGRYVVIGSLIPVVRENE